MIDRGRVRLWTAVMWTTSLGALLLTGSWAATRQRDAWSGPPWPRYGAIHRGSILLFSSLWDHPPRGVHDWTYDALATINTHWPPLRHIGNRYTIAGPTRWGAKLWALDVPLWIVAAASALAAAFAGFRRRAWQRGAQSACPHCAYSLQGLPAGARCPECGR